jgi:RHS repeat-associated protein
MAYMKDAALGSRYRFCLYDRFGRLCVQGTCSGGDRGDSILSATSYAAGSGGICGTGYAAPYSIIDPQLEIVNYYDNYDFTGNDMTNAIPTVDISLEQRQNAIGYLTGTVVFATNGEALGTVSVYDRKGQAVRTVRKGLGGHIEDVGNAYTFTGAVDSTEVRVGVGYGGDFTAKTGYTYQYGKKTKMSLSVSHGGTVQSRETEYSYDAIGRLSTKGRQTIRNYKSYCSYTYDVHGWLKSVSSGGFREDLYYADGLDSACYNGNISTVKWKARNSNSYQGYNMRYDGCNRLYLALFGTGDNLTGNRNYFNEQAEYDCNGNILRLRRCGLRDATHGGFGLVDDLRITYEGNQLASVFDNVWRLPYAGATDFDGVAGQEYPLTYNGAGALVSDASRRIARIDYDCRNNPVRIQFTDGNVTKYVYSATGEKLRVIYQTAVPNISVAIGSTRELMPSEILFTDSTDYLLGGALTLRNGRIDKYQFDEGYCQATQYNATQDNFTFLYYDRDHLGNVRQVTKAIGSNGTVLQTMNYYPFGAQFCDGSAASGDVQPYKYNGKELDKMHGLNTYDYGARQYNPITARWDRPDPLAEKYYPYSPYVYCANNPMKFVDPDGRFPSMWKAQVNRVFSNMEATFTGCTVGDIVYDQNARTENGRYYYNKVSSDGEGGFVVTKVTQMSRELADDVSIIGTGIEGVGYAMTLTGVGAEAGVPTAEAGAAVSTAGTLTGIAIDIFNEDLGGAFKSALFLGAGSKLKKMIDIIPECENLTKDILKYGTDLKMSLMEHTLDEAIINYQDEQIWKEEENKR